MGFLIFISIGKLIKIYYLFVISINFGFLFFLKLSKLDINLDSQVYIMKVIVFVLGSDCICNFVYIESDLWLNYEWDIGIEFIKGKFWISIFWLQ